MRNIIKQSFFATIMMVAICTIPFFVSCEEEEKWERPEDMSKYIPSNSISYSGSSYVSGNTVYLNFTPNIYVDIEYWNLEIESIDYYFDDKLIKSETEEPYSIEYRAKNLAKGTHYFITRVHFKDLTNGKEFYIDSTTEFKI